MEEENAQDAVAVDSSKAGFLSLGEDDETQDECHEQRDDNGRTHKPLFFTDGTENEVGILFRHIFQFCLSPVEKAFSE